MTRERAATYDNSGEKTSCNLDGDSEPCPKREVGKEVGGWRVGEDGEEGGEDGE